MVSADRMRRMLSRAVKEAGSQQAFADLIGVSPAYVCDCLKGRRDIGESIARPLGYAPITAYVPLAGIKTEADREG